jgi:hypothetical protein
MLQRWSIPAIGWRRLASLILAAFLFSSAVVQRSSAQDIIPPKSYSVTPSGINLADATLVYSVTDLAVGTLKLER